MLAWNALLAAGLRAIRPSAVRAQLPHIFVEDPACPTAERRSDRAADRGALRGAERGLLRLVEAHAGAAQTMRLSAMTSCRIIMLEQSAVCAAGNRACRGASSTHTVRKVNRGPAPGVILPVVTRRPFLLAAVAAAALYAEDFTGKVVAISDGDTIRVMHNGVSERIRLWGIDCPEMKQPFGTRAKQFTGDLAFGQVVTVEVRDIDRYKRTVAEIILPDGRNLNQELVRAGLAWWYQRYARRETVLRDLEHEARNAKRGLWSDPNPVAPWDWRKNAAAARKLQGTRRGGGVFLR